MKEELKWVIAEFIRRAPTPEIAANAIVESYMKMEKDWVAEMEERQRIAKAVLAEAVKNCIEIIVNWNIDPDQEEGRKYVLGVLEQIREKAEG